MSEQGLGYLKIRVTSAGGALPVKDAVVTVSEYSMDGDGAIVSSLRTNEGGLTPLVSLAAPPASLSLTPGATRPYALYNVNVTQDGYYPVESVAVPVFDKIVAVLPVSMVPLTEEESIAGADSSGIMIYETPETKTLQPGGQTREDIGSANGDVIGGGAR